MHPVSGSAFSPRRVVASGALACLLLAGCATVPVEPDFEEPEDLVVDPVDEEPVEEPEPEEPVAPPVARQTYSYTRTDASGFQQTLTVTIGPVILGTDTQLMASEWESVGGQGQNPCVDVNPSNDMNTVYEIDDELAGFAFGTLTITNDKPDFAPQPWTYQFTRGGVAALGLGFSNGSRCDALYSGGMLVTPSWGERATWGPVPLVVVVADVRSPAMPDGDAALVSQFPVSIFRSDFEFPLTLRTP